MIDQKQQWIDKISKLKPVGDGDSGAKALAEAVDSCVTKKAQLKGIQGKVTFTFQKKIFHTGLLAAVGTTDTAAGVEIFVTAWANAITASVMKVMPGAVYGSPTPATTFSAVASTTLDPPSLIKARNYLKAELLKSGFVSDAKKCKVGVALHQSFLALTYTIKGTDSTPSPGGPLPLTVPTRPLI